MKTYLTYFKTENHNGDISRRECRFWDINNAYAITRNLSECVDVTGDVDTIDGETGEVLFTFNAGKLAYRSFEVPNSVGE